MRSQGLKIAVVCLLAAVASPVLWGADFIVKGNVKVDGGNGAPGDLTVNGTLTAVKSYKTYIASTGGSLGPVAKLGTWDFCFLSSTSFQGPLEDVICTVSVDPTMPEEGISTKNRLNWTLTAISPKAKNVVCTAICMSFSPKRTGN